MKDRFSIYTDRDIISLPNIEVIVIPANAKAGEYYSLDKYVYEQAGEEDMKAARAKTGDLKIGTCALTDGFRIGKKVIHAVTPSYYIKDSELLLAACYENALEIAREHGLRTIAFPLLGSGNMSFPWSEAEKIARDVLNRKENYNWFYEIVLVEKSISRAIEEADYTDYPTELLEELNAIADYELREQAELIHRQYTAMQRDKKDWEKHLADRKAYYASQGVEDDGLYNISRFTELLRKYTGKDKKYTSHTALAKSLGINNLSRYLNGKSGVFNRDSVIQMALELEMTPDDFKAFVFSSGNSFPTSTRDTVIFEHVKRGIYSMKDIERELAVREKTKRESGR